eukprot:3067928-Alexandrium_andersonii.AAC.1
MMSAPSSSLRSAVACPLTPLGFHAGTFPADSTSTAGDEPDTEPGDEPHSEPKDGPGGEPDEPWAVRSIPPGSTLMR